jgi:hypothetical protein
VQPKRLRQLKIPMTPSEIKPTTFQLVVQCLNQMRRRMLQANVQGIMKLILLAFPIYQIVFYG